MIHCAEFGGRPVLLWQSCDRDTMEIDLVFPMQVGIIAGHCF